MIVEIEFKQILDKKNLNNIEGAGSHSFIANDIGQHLFYDRLF